MNRIDILRVLEYIIFLLISLILIGCENQKCEITSYYDSGSAETKMCLIENEDARVVYVESFYEGGELRTAYYLRNGIFTGEKIDFFPTGQIKSKCIFDHDIRVECKDFDINGRLVLYNYYSNGKTAYIKSIKYDSLNHFEHEGFVPFIKILNDSVRIGDTLEAEVSLPLPDSLMGDHEFFFEYQIKPISLKDSTMFEPSFRFKFSNKKTHKVKIKIESPDNVLFYGHIKDLMDSKPHIYEPTEKLITVLGTDTL